MGSSTFCIQVYTSKFPIYQSFQSCDPEEPSSQAGNEYKQSSHLSACGLPRCKQITQPGQTQEVPAANPNGDRTNYDLAHLPEFKMSRWRNVLSVKILKKKNCTTRTFSAIDFMWRKPNRITNLLCSIAHLHIP